MSLLRLVACTLGLCVLHTSICDWTCTFAEQPAAVLAPSPEQPSPAKLKLGIIGLDSSHCVAFTKIIQAAEAPNQQPFQIQVIAACAGGSSDLPASRDRVEGFTKQMRELGIQIVDSIGQLLPLVDAVLIESVDGRQHLQQAIPVFQSGKRVFIDKPLAGDLTHALAIDLVARKYQANWFTSSSLRFSDSIAKFRTSEYQGKTRGAFAWSPCSTDPSHIDLAWYGIHGVETLYTAMGTGCKSVYRTSTADADEVVGVWEDGRIGTFRGIRQGASGFGMVVFGQQKIDLDAKFDGYAPLVREIDKFLNGAPPPVSNQESLEIIAFMQAADESKARSGQAVELNEIWQRHLAAAQEVVAKLDLPNP